MHNRSAIAYNEISNERTGTRHMKERYKRKTLPALVGILITIGLVGLVLLLHGIATAINTLIQAAFMEYVEYVIIIFLGIVIVRKWLTEYEYEADEENFVVSRVIGNRPRRIFECPFRQMIFIGREKPQDTKGRMIKLTFAAGRKNLVYITYIKDDEKRCAVFSPSENFMEYLGSRLPE